MAARSANALLLSRWLEAHPQHALAMRQQRGGAAITASEVKGNRPEARTIVDGCRLLSITANRGDVDVPASNTHGPITPETRAAAGIGEGLLRIAVGLKAVVDRQNDRERGLAAIWFACCVAPNYAHPNARGCYPSPSLASLSVVSPVLSGFLHAFAALPCSAPGLFLNFHVSAGTEACLARGPIPEHSQ